MKIYVAELTFPGQVVIWDDIYRQRTHLEGNEKFSAFFPPFEKIFSTLESSISEAAVALAFFEDALGRAGQLPPPEVRDEKRRDMMQRTRQIETELEGHYQLSGSDTSDKAFRLRQTISDQARIQYKREQYAKGEMPQGYRQKIPHIYAKTLLYAMDRVSKVFSTFSRELEKVKETWDFLTEDEKQEIDRNKVLLEEIYSRFLEGFPDLSHVRNSSAHKEDRIQFLREKDRKTRKPKEIDIKHQHGIRSVMSETLLGNIFTSLMANGEHGGVEVSERSLLVARDSIQEAIDTFRWVGIGPIHYPV